MTDLDELFVQQYAYLRTHHAHVFDKDPDKQAAHMRNMTLATIVELVELLNETGWKPWAQKRGIKQDAYVKELADVVIFVLNLAIHAGVSASQLSKAVTAKQLVNAERQRDGYAG